MPPRFAYWTILIDNAPTAFRAREAEELLPTLNQLKRTNKDVAMKWFARGRLWESREQEHEDFQRRRAVSKPGAGGRATPRGPGERRGKDWRPGGEHKDPRARFDKEKHRRDKREQRMPDRRPFDQRSTRSPEKFAPYRPPSGQSTGRPPSGHGKGRPPSGHGKGRPPSGHGKGRPTGGHAKGGPPRGDRRPWSGNPPKSAHSQYKSGDRPGQGYRPPPRRDRPPDRPPHLETEAPAPRENKPGGTPQPPPKPEQILTKPEPPERG